MGTVADAMAEELVRTGVDRVFGLPGEEVLHLMDAIRRHGIEFTLCRQESAAGVAAAVYGKIKGTAGVALTTLGPGASNLLSRWRAACSTASLCSRSRRRHPAHRRHSIPTSGCRCTGRLSDLIAV